MIKEEMMGMGDQQELNSIGVGMKVEETAPFAAEENHVGGFEAMEEDQERVVMETIGEKDIWLEDGDQENLLDVNDDSIFYSDFPPLPDFPCMSSTSSSSSAAKPIAATPSSSSASSSSWAVMRSDGEEDTGRRNFHQFAAGDQLVIKPEPAALSSTASMERPPSVDLADVDCIDVMEDFGCMDLIDCNEIWDPSSVFQSENTQQDFPAENAAPPPLVCSEPNREEENGDGFSSFLEGNSELAMIFFDWLKQNKDYISAEDMRSIKLKRSTIESASKRLGNSNEGKKQLLKLILDWVEQCQLQKKRIREAAFVPQSPYAFHQETIQNPDPTPNPNFNYNSVPVQVQPNPNGCFSNSPWMQPIQVQEMVAAQPVFSPPPPPTMVGYGGSDPYSNPIAAAPVVNGIPYPHPAEYPMMDPAQCWAPPAYPMPPPQAQFSPFPDNGNIIPHHQQGFYGNPYPIFDPSGERLVRLGPSATKEARKKRMARQRRLYSHHHRHNNSNQNQGIDDSQLMDGSQNEGDQDNSPTGNWAYWSPGSPPSGMVSPGDSSQPSASADRSAVQSHRQGSSDRRQQESWKTEKNLKFLLQKVLKQSDVGNLGRIVLPKKEAESHLPELESRDGIPIAMEDIGTSQVWNMRYRFWPNNKSRMYLLENTGDFVRVNGLQEGDFIVIYSDTKCGKYMIRGVKVRQTGAKSEGKKPASSRRNANMRNLSLSGNSSSLATLKQAVRCPQ